MTTLDRWFLTPDERGNDSSAIDQRPGGRAAWTEGNLVTALIDGGCYLTTLADRLRSLRRGDLVWFADWRGDAEERLAEDGASVGDVLSDLVRHGVDVRGLVWRSHPDQGKFSEQENLHLGEVVNQAGGQVLLDQRVRRFGSHHQKIVLIRHPGAEGQDVAFVGGIDLCRGRRDDRIHRGDPQAVPLSPRYGPRPPWHDVQVQIVGPAVRDVDVTFRERWDDPTPLDHRTPWRRALARMVRQPARPSPLPTAPADPSPAGGHAVQILRTYPAKRPPYPFAPDGERTVARGYIKALSQASSFIYLEDQYLWSAEVAEVLAGALERSPHLRLIAVVPAHPERDGPLAGPPNRVGQEDALRTVLRAGGDRVGVYDLRNERGQPIYVHAKVCVVDDVWAAVGSDNFNRRSWTHDSEITCAVIDDERDPREPLDPTDRGDGARSFARNLRLELWREHLGPDVPDDELLDVRRGFDAWRRAGVSATSRVRHHRPAPVPRWANWWARPIYRTVVDPDGRSRRLRRAGRF